MKWQETLKPVRSFNSTIRAIVIAEFIVSLATINLNASAQTNTSDGPRWYAVFGDSNVSSVAAARVTQLVVDPTIDDADARFRGFVAHPLWLTTGPDSAVEIGYDKEPYLGNTSQFYYVSETPRNYTYVRRGYATVGTYASEEIIWDANNRVWRYYFNNREIAAAANVGGPVTDSRIEAGLESTSGKNTSPRAPIYNFQYATVANWTWRGWPNTYVYYDPPARSYFVDIYRPTGETRMPY